MRDKIMMITIGVGLALSRFIVTGLGYDYTIINAIISGAISGAIFGLIGEFIYRCASAISKKGWFYYIPSVFGFIIYAGLFYALYLLIMFVILQEKHMIIAHIVSIIAALFTSSRIIRKQIIKYKKSIENSEEVNTQ